jgi:hypothetical protein
MSRVKLGVKTCAGPKPRTIAQSPLLCARKHHKRYNSPTSNVRDVPPVLSCRVDGEQASHVERKTDVLQERVSDEPRRLYIDDTHELETSSQATVSGRHCQSEASNARLLRTADWKNTSAAPFNVGLARLSLNPPRGSQNCYVFFISTALLWSAWDWDAGAAYAADASVGILGPFGPMFVGLQPWDVFWFLLKYPVSFAIVLHCTSAELYIIWAHSVMPNK